MCLRTEKWSHPKKLLKKRTIAWLDEAPNHGKLNEQTYLVVVGTLETGLCGGAAIVQSKDTAPKKIRASKLWICMIAEWLRERGSWE